MSATDKVNQICRKYYLHIKIGDTVSETYRGKVGFVYSVRVNCFVENGYQIFEKWILIGYTEENNSKKEIKLNEFRVRNPYIRKCLLTEKTLLF